VNENKELKATAADLPLPMEFYEVMQKVWDDLLAHEDDSPSYKWMATPYEPIWEAAVKYARTSDPIREAATALVEALDSWPRPPFEDYQIRLTALKAALSGKETK
jgi:hypothetical protein